MWVERCGLEKQTTYRGPTHERLQSRIQTTLASTGLQPRLHVQTHTVLLQYGQQQGLALCTLRP